ncbi:MAG TPA: hypothetical protein VGH23_16305 [Rhizomicrobium sp.]|jgi:hypothetical protein
MNRAAHITPRDIAESALLFAVLHGKPTFSAQDFAAFSDVAALHLDEEIANDILLQVVADGHLREVGPGVYALIEKTEQEALEQPLWPEEARP